MNYILIISQFDENENENENENVLSFFIYSSLLLYVSLRT